jgi:hypothetical protein
MFAVLALMMMATQSLADPCWVEYPSGSSFYKLISNDPYCLNLPPDDAEAQAL